MLVRRITTALVTISIALTLAAPLAHAELNVNPDESDVSNGILPECDPTSTNLTPDGAGCGLSDGIQLIYNIIKYVTIVIIPIAVLLLGYAGFTMMTSAGNTEKMSQAKHIIQLVVIGLAIIMLSALVIRYVFIALDTTEEFRPK